MRAMLPDRTRAYLLISLSATPEIVRRIVQTTPMLSSVWDEATEGRFTPREVIPHLADFEPIFRHRLQQTVAEDDPILLNADEEVLATEGCYSETDPAAESERFALERAKTLELIASLPDTVWERTALHTKIGRMTAETQLVQILVHDGYHVEDLIRRTG
jgi:hypothetical protein